MRKYITILIFGFMLFGIYQSNAQEISRRAMLDSMTTIDPEVRKYFPRWKVCETDLQIQIHRAFVLLGYDDNALNITNIEVLAKPMGDEDFFDILLVSCGSEAMNASEVETNLGILVDYLSGEEPYASDDNGGRRDYCFNDIQPNVPVTQNQARAIVNYLEPTNVAHSFSISLFEQSLKIGDSGFWLKSMVGTDQSGYPFWSSGEAKVVLKRPLYVNHDTKTNVLFPTLINAYLGGGYRITGGLDEGKAALFDFLQNRVLNGAPNGKLIAGFDLNMPFHPFAGLHFNLETPANEVTELAIDKGSFGFYDAPSNIELRNIPYDTEEGIYIVPILQTTCQISLFYNSWLDLQNPENFFRVDLGINYTEVQEYARYNIDEGEEIKDGDYITTQNVNGLKLYKPNEFADWIYFKAEYRSQSAYPFGFSVQYSNQIFLGRVYIPLFSPWFYLEAKYSTPLRDKRPYEIENFFMLSPVLRITI